MTGAMAFGLAGKASATPILYDDFSAPTLNTDKWDVRQDVEGQPLMDEGFVDQVSQNFHMQQNTIGDRRTYLVPKMQFKTGDVIEYNLDVVSKEGNYGAMALLTGDQYWRIGICGFNNTVQGFDELGTSHVRIEFQENNLAIRRESPSGVVSFDNLSLTNPNGDYELYLGAFSGHNGRTHMDFDNFYLDNTRAEKTPEPSSLALLGIGVGALALRRKKKDN